MIYVIDFEIIT